MGFNRRVLRRSDNVDAERVAIGEDRYVIEGMRIRDRNTK